MATDKTVEGRIRRLARIGMVAVVAAGLFAIAYLHASAAATKAKEAATTARSAAAKANDAARAARAVAACLNDQLSRRNTPSANDAKAHIAYANVQQRYDTAFADLTAAIALKKPQAQIKRLFIRVNGLANDKRIASAIYTTTLKAGQAYRDAHPLGNC